MTKWIAVVLILCGAAYGQTEGGYGICIHREGEPCIPEPPPQQHIRKCGPDNHDAMCWEPEPMHKCRNVDGMSYETREPCDPTIEIDIPPAFDNTIQFSSGFDGHILLKCPYGSFCKSNPPDIPTVVPERTKYIEIQGDGITRNFYDWYEDIHKFSWPDCSRIEDGYEWMSHDGVVQKCINGVLEYEYWVKTPQPWTDWKALEEPLIGGVDRESIFIPLSH